MWFGHMSGYEKPLFQIAGILVTEASIFIVFWELNLACQNVKRSPTYEFHGVQVDVRNRLFAFAWFLEQVGDSHPLPCGPSKHLNE